jgi:hypothetical protein
MGLGLVGRPDARCIFLPPTDICKPRVAATALACGAGLGTVESASAAGYVTIRGDGLGGVPEPVCSDVPCLLLASSWSVSPSLSSGMETSSPSLSSSVAKCPRQNPSSTLTHVKYSRSSFLPAMPSMRSVAVFA